MRRERAVPSPLFFCLSRHTLSFAVYSFHLCRALPILGRARRKGMDLFHLSFFKWANMKCRLCAPKVEMSPFCSQNAERVHHWHETQLLFFPFIIFPRECYVQIYSHFFTDIFASHPLPSSLVSLLDSSAISFENLNKAIFVFADSLFSSVFVFCVSSSLKYFFFFQSTIVPQSSAMSVAG